MYRRRTAHKDCYPLMSLRCKAYTDRVPCPLELISVLRLRTVKRHWNDFAPRTLDVSRMGAAETDVSLAPDAQYLGRAWADAGASRSQLPLTSSNAICVSAQVRSWMLASSPTPWQSAPASRFAYQSTCT